MSVLKDKENKPPSSSIRAKSSIPSLVKSPQKEELFTNSFLGLDDASQTSLIPTPQKGNTSLSKPRKKIGVKHVQHSSHEQPKSYNSSKADAAFLLPPDRPSSRSSIPRRRSPLRPIRASTPTFSTEDSSIASPLSTFSSPPHALTENYERIEQEEDLAATEGQISDPDDLPMDDGDDLSLPGRQSLNRRLFLDAGRHGANPSRGPTPTQEKLNAVMNGSVSDRVEVMSDPTGMSFFEQMEDRDLAAKLTPIALQAAADKQALRKAWSQQRPIAFGKAMKFRHGTAATAPQAAQRETIPRENGFEGSSNYRGLVRASTNGHGHHQRTFSDITENLERPFSEVKEKRERNEAGDNQDFARTLPLNHNVHRPHYFAKNHGFPPRSQHMVETEFVPKLVHNTDERSRSGSPASGKHNAAITDRPTQGFVSKAPTLWSLSLKEERSRNSSGHSDEGKILSNGKVSENNSPHSDWAQMRADIALPSIEENELKRSSSSTTPNQKTISPDKQRRWDNDFTGLSFQVSESPPVRSKAQAEEHARSREIQGLEKAAVTTNRLTQLRERESREQLRSPSKSPAPESRSRIDSENGGGSTQEHTSNLEKKRADVSFIPRRSTSSTTAERPSVERNKSHDILQRLARGSSSTPRSSPPPPGGITRESITKALSDGQVTDAVQKPLTTDLEPEQTPSGDVYREKVPFNQVEETPRVSGAWTDTILLDTVKTIKPAQKVLSYTQTPHISAGGWVDTPYVPAESQPLPSVTEDVHEVPAELMQGIVKDEPQEHKLTVEVESKQNETTIPPMAVPKSMALQLLAEQKDKRKVLQTKMNQDSDTLNLGNATIQSLEDLLDMDEAEITTLSRLGDNTLPLDAEFNEDEILERLGIKLDRLRNHIHDARKGIAKLEHQVSARAQEEEAVTLQQTEQGTAQVILQPVSKQATTTSSLSGWPAALITINLPIPLLFHPRQAGEMRRFPRPTMLGWVTLAFWSWYLIECTLSELYSHPQYAEFYVWPTEPEPKFPFVLPTMLWRWSRMDFLHSLVIQPFYHVFRALFKVISMWLGLTDGFADGEYSPTATGPADMSFSQRTEDLNIMSDEFI